jgi:hypothetical protein
MGRQPKQDRGEVKTIVVGVKLTEGEREALGRLVEMRSDEIEEMMGERIEATASGVLRWLLVKEAKARGIPTGAGESRPPPPPEPEPPARPKAAPKTAKGKPSKGRK